MEREPCDVFIYALPYLHKPFIPTCHMTVRKNRKYTEASSCVHALLPTAVCASCFASTEADCRRHRKFCQ